MIEPALTLEGWATFRENEGLRQLADEPAAYLVRAIAVANHMLPDDDQRKITRRMVTRMQEAGGALEDAGAPHLGAALIADAERLAALLPPN
jgi:hypothetical protein